MQEHRFDWSGQRGSKGRVIDCKTKIADIQTNKSTGAVYCCIQQSCLQILKCTISRSTYKENRITHIPYSNPHQSILSPTAHLSLEEMPYAPWDSCHSMLLPYHALLFSPQFVTPHQQTTARHHGIACWDSQGSLWGEDKRCDQEPIRDSTWSIFWACMASECVFRGYTSSSDQLHRKI